MKSILKGYCVAFFGVLAWLSSSHAAIANESDLVVDVMNEISQKLNDTCDEEKRLFCMRMALELTSQYFDLCKYIVAGTDLKAEDNPEVCQMATIGQYNEFVEVSSMKLRAEWGLKHENGEEE